MASPRGGLYALARHPQYLGLAILGLGAFVVRPRVLVLIMYVTMVFLYGLLARREEARCLEKFGGAYREYRSRTGMFFPWPPPRGIPWPAVGPRRTLATVSLYVVAVAATVVLGYWLRDYALTHLSAYYAEDMAVLSPARLTDAELRAAIRVATSAAEIRQRIERARRGALIVYVLPEAWQIADLPLDAASAERQAETDRGHHVPLNFDRVHYRVLVTRARTHAPEVRGPAIVKKAYGLDPIVVVRVNIQKAQITGIDTPPPHVRWGQHLHAALLASSMSGRKRPEHGMSWRTLREGADACVDYTGPSGPVGHGDVDADTVVQAPKVPGHIYPDPKLGGGGRDIA
jgi:hypothetical protein